MKELYRKRGSVVRYEDGHLIHSVEAGEAIDDGKVFRAKPIAVKGAPWFPADHVQTIAQRIKWSITPSQEIERLIIAQGNAEHLCGDVRWSESTTRVHLAIVNRRRGLRVLVDLADYDLSDIDLADDALARAGSERYVPARVRLAPNVAAALLPSLVGTNVVELWQSAAEHDGKGLAVIEQRVTAPPWPNWFRPSYRTRPVRMPLHLRAAATANTINDDVPRAVALLAPVAGNVLHVLCVDGDDVFPTTIAVERVLASGSPTRWYPYGGGSFGAEMLV